MRVLQWKRKFTPFKSGADAVRVQRMGSVLTQPEIYNQVVARDNGEASIYPAGKFPLIIPPCNRFIVIVCIGKYLQKVFSFEVRIESIKEESPDRWFADVTYFIIIESPRASPCSPTPCVVVVR